MELKLKIKNKNQKFYTMEGPDEWLDIDWHAIALKIPPHYDIKSRIHRVFADLYTDYQNLMVQEQRSVAEKTARVQMADKSEWPRYNDGPDEITADERTPYGHVLYARPRSGAKGAGPAFNGWLCPCSFGEPCVRS